MEENIDFNPAAKCVPRIFPIFLHCDGGSEKKNEQRSG